MRGKLLMACLLLVAIQSFSQKKFNGTIRYEMRGSKDTAVLVDIMSWFYRDAIKFKMTVKKNIPGADLKNETIYLNFKDSTIAHVHDDRKEVEIQPLVKRSDSSAATMMLQRNDTLPQLTILGYSGNPYAIPALEKKEMKDGKEMSVGLELVVWYAHDLLFPVPEALMGKEMTPLFTNGNVALGSNISVAAGPLKLLLQTRAVSVKTMKRSALKKTFRYPDGYKIVYND